MGRGARGSAGKRIWPWILLGIIGLLVMCAPLLEDMASQAQAHQRITQAEDAYSDRESPERLAALAQAQAYNRKAAGDDPGTDVLPYGEQLTYGDPDMICWVEVPKAGIELPVGHGCGEDTLSRGAGHLEGSSLPVGGDTSNCVITAHSGLRSARMFDDIRLLEVGDTFALRTLGDTYAYRVVDVRTISEDDVESWNAACALKPGRDLCTLVTCTPYFVNDHRLIVTGERVPDGDAADDGGPSAALVLDPRTLIALAAAASIIPMLASAAMRREPMAFRTVETDGGTLEFAEPVVARISRGPFRWSARVRGAGVRVRAESRSALAYDVPEALARTWERGAVPGAGRRARRARAWLESRTLG